MDIKECQQELNTLYCDTTQRNILHSHLKKYNIINFPKSNLILKNNYINDNEIKDKKNYIFNINSEKNIFINKYCNALDIKKINDFLTKKKDNKLIYYFKFICNEHYSNNNILEKYIYEYQINKFVSDINYNSCFINNDIYNLLINIFDTFYFKYKNNNDIIFNNNIKYDNFIFNNIVINLDLNLNNEIHGKINSKFFNLENNKIVLNYNEIYILYNKLIGYIRKNKCNINKINVIRPITFFELNGNDIFLNKNSSKIGIYLNKFYTHNKINNNFGCIIYKNYTDSITLDSVLKNIHIITNNYNIDNLNNIDISNFKNLEYKFLKIIDNNINNIEYLIDSIIFQILFTLYKITSIYPSFRHNDLHMKNVIIYPKNKEKNSYYTLDNKIYIINKKYKLKLIDYELSSINQVIFNKYIDNECFNNTYGLNNNINLDYDLHFFFNILYNHIKINKYKDFVLRYIKKEYLVNNNLFINNWRIKKEIKLNLSFEKILSDTIFNKFLLYKL